MGFPSEQKDGDNVNT